MNWRLVTLNNAYDMNSGLMNRFSALTCICCSMSKASNTETLDLCQSKDLNILGQRKSFLFMRQGGIFILNLRIYCSFYHGEAGIFKCFVLFGNCE